jgi:hypothetical protein
VNVEQLMTARHVAYRKAFAGNFQNGTDVLAWREANRVYVAARRANRAALMPSVFIGTSQKPHAGGLMTPRDVSVRPAA